MNETQFCILVAVMPVTTIIIVLIGVLRNNNNMNSRLNDMGGRLNDLKELLRAEIAKSRRAAQPEIGSRFLHCTQAAVADHPQGLTDLLHLGRRTPRHGSWPV